MVDASGDQSIAGVALGTSGASFINGAVGVIYLGRAPQKAKSDAAEEVAIN
ncbi:hypothetical protein [Candidatus Pantoea persica]|uniref:hypothetical protein n=1 Tax=Candidatus Pantoea persica TaxID=2518128 RepID=UPI00215D624A|nr:hypothetical protein [Candidatus Pantoea persica]MBA2815495.1 outer membrane autotransporter barrel domain-containing protein [Candidatus Pantoea persica]